MKEPHELAKSITNSMRTFLKGEVKFVESFNNWSINVFVKWNMKRIRITIKCRKLDLQTEFVPCALSDANFLSFITRSDTVSFSGGKSEFSELIIKSKAAQSLMGSRNASIKLNGKYLTFNGGLRKNDESSLSNVFVLIEILTKEIDELNVETVTRRKE